MVDNYNLSCWRYLLSATFLTIFWMHFFTKESCHLCLTVCSHGLLHSLGSGNWNTSLCNHLKNISSYYGRKIFDKSALETGPEEFLINVLRKGIVMEPAPPVSCLLIHHHWWPDLVILHNLNLLMVVAWCLISKCQMCSGIVCIATSDLRHDPLLLVD